MSNERIEETLKIRAQYETKEPTKLDKLKALDREVKRPANVFAYVFGSIGALVLGAGMCLAMPEVIEGYMPLGICVGIVGILMVSVNYFFYKKILNSRRTKYSAKVLEMSEDILNNK